MSVVASTSILDCLRDEVFTLAGNNAPLHALSRLVGSARDLLKGFIERQVMTYGILGVC